MKKLIIFILAFITLVLNASLGANCAEKTMLVNENQVPLFEPGRQWNIGNNSVSEEPINPYNRWTTYYQTISGDTIINGKEYKVLYQSNDSLFFQKSTVNFVRADSTGKVYASNGFNDRTILSFNMKQGDSLIIDYFENEDIKLMVKVDSVRKINLNDQCVYKSLYVKVFNYYKNKYDLGTYFHDIWVSEIGSLKFGLLIPYPYITGSGNHKVLLCHSINNQLVYINPQYNTCSIFTGLERHEANENLIDVIPVGGGILQLNIHKEMKGKLSVFDISGQQVVREMQVNGNTEIDMPIAGLHMFRFTSNRGQIQTGKVLVK